MHILTKLQCPKFENVFLTGFLKDHTEFKIQLAKSLKNLVESMPRMLEDIIRREGNNTKY
jgi:hypothetical protein